MDVAPGITGLAQINGRNQTDWNTRLDLDVAYTERASLRTDLTIIMRTLPAVMTARGIATSGHATMPEFTGEPAAPIDPPDDPDEKPSSSPLSSVRPLQTGRRSVPDGVVPLAGDL